MSADDDLGDFSLMEMFRTEVETQAVAMTAGLLALERDPGAAQHLEEVMRGAHSLKGAASIVGRKPAVTVAHAMEDCLVAAQRGSLDLPQERIDVLLQGVDLLSRIANVAEEEIQRWTAQNQSKVDAFVKSLAAPVPGEPASITAATAEADSAGSSESSEATPPPELPAEAVLADSSDAPSAAAPRPKPAAAAAVPSEAASRALRVAADNLNRLLGLAGETVVASRWVHSFATDLLRLKRLQNEVAQSLNGLRQQLAEMEVDERTQSQFIDLQNKAANSRQMLASRLDDLELFDGRFFNLSKRLYQEVLDCRMRPFADGIHGLSRMVRDAARTLGKEVKLEIRGEATAVDREILERVEAPLGHLLRNAVDHGLESPADRRLAGKSGEGQLRLEARHSAGMLLIEVADDGRGIDIEAMRRAIVTKRLTTADLAEKLTEAELLEFLFLPGFTMKDNVTEISGRGVGLDVVQTMVKAVGGNVRISSQLGQGTQFQLQLPLTLSVLRTLLVEISGEPYAFPLARISRALKVPREKIDSVEGREHFTLGELQIGLVTAHQVLGLKPSRTADEEVSVIVLGDKNTHYGVVMDRFLGERELVVRPLDPRLGKVKDISAAALMPDQSPVLIVDVDDLIRSIENLVSGGRLAHVWRGASAAAAHKRKRVLVVDDSLTVRELERKLIESKGYEVEIAVDGMDGWNAVRTGSYDLVLTDVDMPRLDGIELVTLIKKDVRLNALPVMIVSYKDREEDRRRGLDAGADYYLTKGSFHDETLLRAVADLIGEADA
jgi:two-component system sensor histidine kinase and response regulator WspE